MCNAHSKWRMSYCFASLLLLLSSQTTFAEGEAKRFGVEVGIGTESFLYGFVQSKFLYVPSLLNNHLAIYFLYAKGEAVAYVDVAPHLQYFQIGSKLYIINQNVFRPYIAVQGGVNLISEGTTNVSILPLIYIGAGSDFMFTEHLGLTTGLLFSLAYPMILVRPELNLKLQF